jgi:hypothetical protein
MLVNRKTDICIEGYPRSANSYTVEVVRQASKGALTIAHHTHLPAQVLYAYEIDIPIVILVRDPINAVVSRHATRRQESIGRREWEKYITLETDLREWLLFYRTVSEIGDDILFCEFADIIESPNKVVKYVKRKYNNINMECLKKDAVEISQERGKHASPSKKRDKIKREVRRRLEENRDRLEESIDKCHKMYSKILDCYTV